MYRSFIISYKPVGFGWDEVQVDAECHTLLKDEIEELKEDYGKDTLVKVTEITRRKIPLKSIMS